MLFFPLVVVDVSSQQLTEAIVSLKCVILLYIENVLVGGRLRTVVRSLTWRRTLCVTMRVCVMTQCDLKGVAECGTCVSAGI